MTDISEPARIAYEAGVAPLDHAVLEVANLLDAHAKTAAFCARHGYTNQVDVSPGAMSCRILGLLLGAGWLPPGGLEIPEEMTL